MGRRKLIETYYVDLNNLADLLNKLVNSYRLLIGGADELNKIALAKKKEVREALKRADNLGYVIDEIIEALDATSFNYLEYCKLKSELIKEKVDSHHIIDEIDTELKLEDISTKS